MLHRAFQWAVAQVTLALARQAYKFIKAELAELFLRSVCPGA